MGFNFKVSVYFFICIQVFCLSCTDEQESFDKTHTIDGDATIIIAENIRFQVLERYCPSILRIETEIPSFIQTFREDGSWSDVNYEGVGMAYWEPIAHLERIEELSVAYHLCDSYRNKKTLDMVNKALDYWREHQYVSNNWWFNSIGACNILGEVLILLDSFITDINRIYFVEYINRLKLEDYAGANRVDIARYHFYRGVCLNNDSIISKCAHMTFSELTYKQSSGIQVDGSSLMEDIRNIGGYGEEALSGIVKLGLYVQNTKYQLSNNLRNFLSNYFLNTYLNTLRGGYIDYAALGRAISRPDYLKRTALIPVLKGMAELDGVNSGKYLQTIEELEGTDNISSNNAYSHFFWKAEYMLHCNERYNISVGGTSNRLKKPERGNGENLLGTLLSLGTTTFRITGNEYFNIFPCWDWSKIPGVTSTDAVPDFEGNWGIYGGSAFSGGVSDGTNSCYAFILNDSGLKGEKGYYGINDGLICLGNSLKSATGLSLRTTIEQCLYKGGHEVFKDDNGYIKKIEHNNIWYVPLEQIDQNEITITAEQVKGNWRLIKDNAPDEEIIENIFSIILNHSSQDKYAYLIIPNPIDSEIVEGIKRVHPTFRVIVV